MLAEQSPDCPLGEEIPGLVSVREEVSVLERRQPLGNLSSRDLPVVVMERAMDRQIGRQLRQKRGILDLPGGAGGCGHHDGAPAVTGHVLHELCDALHSDPSLGRESRCDDETGLHGCFALAGRFTHLSSG